MHCFSRTLPSLESPQQEFLTPTEEIVAPLRQKGLQLQEQAAEKTTEISAPHIVKRPVDLPDLLQVKTELPETAGQTGDHPESKQSAIVEPPEETKGAELSEPPKQEEHPPEELPEPEERPVPTSDTADLPEPQEKEEPQLNYKTTEPLEPEKKPAGEKPVEIPPEKPFKVTAEETAETEGVQDPAEELQECG